MKLHKIIVEIEEYTNINTLPKDDQQLAQLAISSAKKAWAPYSKFKVGAAVLLADGQMIQGNNQENAAYPSGLCAERVALFYANAANPLLPVVSIAIVAQKEGKILQQPVTPCGSCRQVMLETENRFKQPIRIILVGAETIQIISSCHSLLPLAFDPDSLPSL
jgi:cytidine deaminase